MLAGKTYGIPAVAPRFFNVYGPRQSLSNPYTGAAAIFASRIKNDNPPLIYEDGKQSRDFISVHDVVAAKAAGLRTALIRRGPWGYLWADDPLVRRDADWVIDSLHDLPELLADA